ncbi:MAG: F0F1 ATP synthase subunit B [Armatimonadetes bacterium]|nr:F0F1 ATP synthase subunit B [Armatimonadota bacterium]
MEEILTNLNFNPGVWLVNFLGFGLLLWTANKMVFTPIGKVIEERQGDIQKTYDQLDADQRQMQSLKSEYEAQLAAIEAEGRDRINNMIKEAQSTRDSVLSDANSRAHELVSRAEAEVEREKEQAMITLRSQVADLAIGAAERVIGSNLDEARSRRLVDDFITSGGAPAPDYAKPAVTETQNVTFAKEPVAVVTPVETPKPGTGSTLLAGAVAAGVAAVAAVATAVANKSADAAPKVATETVAETLVGVPETVVTGVAESAPDVTAAPKKPRAPRKKTDSTAEGEA